MGTQRVDFSRLFFVARGAVQPILYSWLLFLVFSLFFYAVTASAPMLGDATWGSAASFTTCLWLTAFGGRCVVNMAPSTQNTMDPDAMSESLASAADASLAVGGSVGDGYIQLMPLTLTFLVAYALATVLRRRMLHAWGEVGVVVAVHAVVTGVIGLSMRLQGAWWIGVIGASLCAGLCALWAGRLYLFSHRPWWDVCESLMPRVAGLMKILIVEAIVVFGVAVVLGIPSIIEIHASYMAGIWGGIGLILIQLLYLPTVLIWAFSWLIGAGFSIGEGSYFSIFDTQLQPIPAIPLFGALPQNNAWAALVLIPVVAMIVWRACKDVVLAHDKGFSLWGYMRQALSVAVIVVAIIVVAGGLSRGSLGPERMLLVGTRPELLLAAAAAVIALPYVLASWGAGWYYLRKDRKYSDVAGGESADSETAPSADVPSSHDAEDQEKDGALPDAHHAVISVENPTMQDEQWPLDGRSPEGSLSVEDNGGALGAPDIASPKESESSSHPSDANSADLDNEEQSNADSL